MSESTTSGVQNGEHVLHPRVNETTPFLSGVVTVMLNAITQTTVRGRQPERVGQLVPRAADLLPSRLEMHGHYCGFCGQKPDACWDKRSNPLWRKALEDDEQA